MSMNLDEEKSPRSVQDNNNSFQRKDDMNQTMGYQTKKSPSPIKKHCKLPSPNPFHPLLKPLMVLDHSTTKLIIQDIQNNSFECNADFYSAFI